jgi:peptidoglycan/xylan/chitin deacetylase (PgdA/CDA1 family)
VALQQFLLDRLFGALSIAGVPKLVGRWQAGRGAILAFHRVHHAGDGEFGAHAISVPPEDFRNILETLTHRGYTFLSMSGLVDLLVGRNAITGPVVCLTFDDGFADTYTCAFPICREYRVPMTVYLVSGFVTGEFPMWGFGLEAAVAAGGDLVVPIDGQTLRVSCRSARAKRVAYRTLASRLAVAHPDDISRCCESLSRSHGIDFMTATNRPVLTPLMIREMRDSGLVEFGAHSMRHARLACLNNAEVRWEIARSKSDCEALVGRKIRHFAYPYGDAAAAGEREAAICAELGFNSAVTTESSTIFPSDAARLFALPRVTFNGRIAWAPQLDLLLSGALPAARRRWHSWRAWRPLAPRARRGAEATA